MRKLSQARNKKAQKEVLYSEELVEALKKEDKSEYEAELIRKKTAGLSFFSGYYEEKLDHLHKQACFKFKYEFMKKGSIVFKIFSQSEKFYILLNGILEMHGQKPSDEEEIEQDHDVKSNSTNNEQNKSNENNNNQAKNDKKDIVLYLQKILKPGSCFGEIGLICNKSRTGTISCSEDSHFAVLEKQDFVAILKPIEEKKLMKQTEFLGSLPCFNGWPFHFLRDVHLNINKRQLNRGDYVFHEGDKATFVAIVTKGRFYVYKEFVVQKPIVTEDKAANELTTLQGERIPKKRKQEIVAKQPFNVNEGSLKSKKEVKKILELGDKDLFGEEDVVKNRKRQYSVKCEGSEGGEIIIITKQVFRERILCRDIANRTITSRIPLKEQLFQEHVELIQTNFKNYKKLLRENRAELISDKLKQQRLQQEQEEYYMKYFSNQAQEDLQKDNSFEVISSNNKIYDRSDLYIKNIDLGNSFEQTNEIAAFSSMNNSMVQPYYSSQIQRRKSANTPINPNLNSERGSPIQNKILRQPSRNNQREDKKKQAQESSPIQFVDQNMHIPQLIDQTNEIVNNKTNERKYGGSVQDDIEDEIELMSGSNTYRSSVYNRRNLMMDEKGNGIPLIDPMKNEEELDRQVRKHLHKQTKRKNYLGEWRNGINQMDKVYGILRNAGYFDQRLQEIKNLKQYKQISPREYDISQADTTRNQSQKGNQNSNSSRVDSPNRSQLGLNYQKNGKEQRIYLDKENLIQNISQLEEMEDEKQIQQQKKDQPDPSNIVDYYLNQSNLYSIGCNEEAESMNKNNEFISHRIISTNKGSYNPQNKKYVPPICLQNGKTSPQNTQQIYSQIGSGNLNSGDENASSLNYPLKSNRYSKWQLINKASVTLSQVQTKQAMYSNSLLSYREQGILTRKSIGNSSSRAGQQSARDYQSRAVSMAGGHKEINSSSPFNSNLSNPSSARQSRQQQRTPSQLLQDLSRPLTRNRLLKSSTPIDFTERNTSILLEGFKEHLPKPFKEFNPSQKPLSMNQNLRDEYKINAQDPYFSNCSGYQNTNGQGNRFKVKQTINQFMNRHTKKQMLFITEGPILSENKSLMSDDIIDFSKNQLQRIQKHSNKSRDNSFNHKLKAYI